MSSADPPAVTHAPTVAAGGRLGAATAGLFVVLFAFLLASFPSRNPDLWGHLAAGRDLAHGRIPTASTDGHADPTWDFDLACYAIYSAAGPGGLVFAKAVLAGVLALILLLLSRTGPGWLIPALCTGLAVLTLGSRMLLQPASASYLFLAVALWLVRPGAGRASVWLLVALAVVWANTDRWFVIGLGTVGLVLVGRALDRPPGERIRALGKAALLLVMLAAATVVNPAHVRAYTQALATAGPGGLGVTSPFRRAYVTAMAESPVGLAYLPLAGLGLLSFALAGRPWRWERALPWIALAALSGWQVRFAPFFAVVGGPVLAWNLQDYFARRAAAGGAVGRRTRVAVGALAGLFGLAFVAAAWPGWLQGPPFGPRRWAVETSPGLKRGAETVCRWEADGRLGPGARALHLSADSVGAFAWFCPGHRGLRDPDLAAGLLGDPGGPTDWPARLRAAGVTYLVVYDTDRRRLTPVLDHLFSDPEQWPLLHLTGGVTVFGWRDPAREPGPDPFRGMTWDPDRQAVWPAREDLPPPARPPRDPDPKRWWEAFWVPTPRAADDRDEAAACLRWAEAERRVAVARHAAAWQAGEVAGMVAAAAGGEPGPAGLFGVHTRLELALPEPTEAGGFAHPLGQLVRAFGPAFRQARGDTSPALLYLAVRAGRRAVAANPLDPQAHAVLGEAYLRLARDSRERHWGRTLSELLQLRRAQAVAELAQAVSLDPGLARAHLQLAEVYADMGFLDLAVRHQRDSLDALRRAGPAPGTPAADYRAAVLEAQAGLDRLAEIVDEQEAIFAREASGMRVYDRALRAKDMGLTGKARDILLGSDISAFGANGLALELELLARTGRVKEVRDWTAPEHAGALGPLYQWLRILAFAAGGDYDLAREEAGRLASTGLDPGAPDGPGPGIRELTAARIGLAVLDGLRGPPGHRSGALWEAFRQADFRARLGQFVTAIRREADTLTLRGLLELEEGDTVAAAADFRQALLAWTSPEADPDAARIEFNGRLAARQSLDWIESIPPGPVP
jgi:hypothetical protein